MSVDVVLHGRLGNHLFQYSIGRIIAERLGLALHCTTAGVFPDYLSGTVDFGGGPVTLPELASYFPHAPLVIDGQRAIVPREWFDIIDSGRSQNVIPLDAILSNTQARHIVLHGYFERSVYLLEHLSSIKDWFSLTKPAQDRMSRTDIVLHIRRGIDFAARGWTLPLSYYGRALAAAGCFGQLHICGIGIGDDVKQYFQRYEPIYHSGSFMDQFLLLGAFKKIVLSNEVSAWWSAFVSDADFICAPHAADGSGYAFTGFRDVDLHMRQPRYHQVPVETFARTSWTLESSVVGARLYESGDDLFVDSWDGVHRFNGGRVHRGLLLYLSGQPSVDIEQLRAQFSEVDIDLAIRWLMEQGLALWRYKHLN